MSDIILKIENINKTFENTTALQNINLEVKKGEFLTLLGPSGCGKTTLLRIIAGLENPDNGKIILEGKDVTYEEPNKRDVNTVFQNYALFPHMTVKQNIAYGLKLKKMPTAQIDKKVAEMLDLIQLPEYGNRTPEKLSGGQRQRVAIARALVNNPSVLLLDEPLGALDLQLRKQMQVELKRLQQLFGTTFVYITHDQEEALNMSDRIGIMRSGNLEQLGTPEDIYERPETRFAAEFIGQSNIINAKVLEKGENGLLKLCYAGGVVEACGNAEVGDLLTISVRTERIRYSISDTKHGFSLKGKVKDHHFTGGMRRTTLLLDGGDEIVVSGLGGSGDFQAVGSEVFIEWDPSCTSIVGRGEADGQN